MATRDELVSKVLNLHNRLKELKKIKKAMNIDYRDQIKDVESELGEVISELGEDTGIKVS